MAEGVVISEGKLVTENEGSLAQVDIDGPIRTAHDALYAYPGGMQSNGTLISGNTTGAVLPRWTLANAADELVKWVWEIPVGWNAATFRWGSTRESANAGTVNWVFSYATIFLGEGNVDKAVTSIAVSGAAPGGQGAYFYNTPAATTNIPIASGFFGDKPLMLCSLQRLGTADANTGGISVSLCTLTRVG